MKTNNFEERTRFALLEDNHWTCWACGKNHANCLHHIFGRGQKDGREEGSALNAAPMNNMECHLPRHGYWMTNEGRRFLFQKTLDHLIRIDYRLSLRDKSFLLKYKREITNLGIKI